MVKRRLYQAQGVSVYSIVDPATRAVERWLPGSREATVVNGALDWQPSPRREPLVIDLPTLFRDAQGDRVRGGSAPGEARR